jgi:signal transduction histidine kinase
LIQLDPTEGVWARVAAEGQAILLAHPIQNARLRAHYRDRGIRDAMVAPLHGKDGVAGVILVGNRLGDVSTFDRQDLQLFETLANHASVSLENARLVARLEESLAHLKEMNRLKDDFVATVSHELRTPLTNIQGSVKTLLRLDLGPEDQRDLLEAADRGSERLRHLIEDLLMASRIEAREVRAEIAAASLPALLDEAVSQIGAERRGRGLRVDVDPGIGLLQTDERKVVQIISNLLDNAVKYSSEGSTVGVRVRGEAEGVVVSVTNEGPPIPAGEQELVFDRFYQVDQTSTRTVGGAGLGLFICRTLAEAIGGRVWLERSDRDATTFALFVPSRGGAPDRPPVAVPHDEPIA